ncbi:MAG: hypothetical protein V1858_02670 [Candidatus Gottesmanbacteria bacterium]
MANKETGEQIGILKAREVLRHFVEKDSIFNTDEGREKITRGLSLLASGPGPTSLTPQKRLELALEVSDKNTATVAYNHGLNFHTVERTVRDTIASAICLQEQYDQSKISIDINKRITDLKRIEEKLVKALTIRQSNVLTRALKKVPHVSYLIDYFLKWGTVKYLLDDLGIPYTSYQLRSVYRFLMTSSPEESLDGITTLATRFSLALWLRGQNTFSIDGGDRLVARAAGFLYAYKGPRLKLQEQVRINMIKTFLAEMMRQEFDNTITNFKGEKDGIINCFPRKDGNPAQNRWDLDIKRCYEIFAQEEYCPSSIRNYALQYIKGLSQKKRIFHIFSHPDEVYSDNWRKSLDWAGIKFLENVLVHRGLELNFKILNQNTAEILKEAKRKTLLAVKSD